MVVCKPCRGLPAQHRKRHRRIVDLVKINIEGLSYPLLCVRKKLLKVCRDMFAAPASPMLLTRMPITLPCRQGRRTTVIHRRGSQMQ